jgi:hypothetical protein
MFMPLLCENERFHLAFIRRKTDYLGGIRIGIPRVTEMPRSAGRKLAGLVSIAIAAVATSGIPAHGENSEIAIRRAAERTSFTDAEIMDGFFKLAFRAELQLDGNTERIRKFDEPVRVVVVGKPARRADIAAIIADIRARVAHLDIALVGDLRSANFVVMLVPKPDFKRTVRSLYGRERAKQIQGRLAPQCLSGIGKDERYRIRRAEVLLPADAEDFTFYDCAYEEILQGLGIINDDASVPWTMFNDDVQMGFFDVYDQYLLNILYDPRVRPGMTREDFSKLATEVVPAVRDWIASTNRPQNADVSGASIGPTEAFAKSAVRSAPRRGPGRG